MQVDEKKTREQRGKKKTRYCTTLSGKGGKKGKATRTREHFCLSEAVISRMDMRYTINGDVFVVLSFQYYTV